MKAYTVYLVILGIGSIVLGYFVQNGFITYTMDTGTALAVLGFSWVCIGAMYAVLIL